MKKISMLALALFLIFTFVFQVYAEQISAGTTGTTVNTRTDVDTRGMGTMDNRTKWDTRNVDPTVNFDSDGTTFNRNRTMDNPPMNNYRTTATTGNNNGWGWLGILGLLGLAGMFGRNRNPER